MIIVIYPLWFVQSSSDPRVWGEGEKYIIMSNISQLCIITLWIWGVQTDAVEHVADLMDWQSFIAILKFVEHT